MLANHQVMLILDIFHALDVQVSLDGVFNLQTRLFFPVLILEEERRRNIRRNDEPEREIIVSVRHPSARRLVHLLLSVDVSVILLIPVRYSPSVFFFTYIDVVGETRFFLALKFDLQIVDVDTTSWCPHANVNFAVDLFSW